MATITSHHRSKRDLANPAMNRLEEGDLAAHGWYRFVLSFPAHIVRDYISRFGIKPGMRVLDPFCGTGTTIVECRKRGINAVGIEANTMAAFASRVKGDWSVSPRAIREFAAEVRDVALNRLAIDGIADDLDPLRLLRESESVSSRSPLRDLAADRKSLLLANCISPLPLHKALVLTEELDRRVGRRAADHARLAFARSLVEHSSNLHFGPEVGVSPPKPDAPVIGPWYEGLTRIASDIESLRDSGGSEYTVHHADSRACIERLEPESIDAVFTSPPYPNEKDYTRTTRLESVLLGFLNNKAELRALKKGLIRSNTRTVYKQDDDHLWVADNAKIEAIAQAIESRRIELGKTSGFERLYHRVTRLYFGGMAKHLADLRPALKPGAMLGYVVGDQASYLRIMIRTGELLAEIAESLGYEVVGIDLFRTRLATATREQLREETVVLRWPGSRRTRRTPSRGKAAP